MESKLSLYFRIHVKAKMVEFGWTHQDLANAMGVDRSYVSQLLRGHRSPGFKTLEDMAKALEVPAGSLIEPVEAPAEKVAS